MVPHVAPDGVWQILPAQHPVGHESLLHTQVPFTQSCPIPHAPPSPHRQAPAAEQPSDVALPHALHAAPAAPHWAAVVVVTQVVPAQQPLGHDVASQVHLPAAQRWPAAQAGLAPQRQAPFVQVSARVVSQGVHTAPPTPQLPTAGALQLEPMQHPLAQVVALQPLQLPPMQVSTPGQVSHRLPPAPQAVASVPATHWPAALQQPLGHDVASHMQLLPLQRWPAAHTAPTPQRHVPIDEQLSER